MGIISMLYPFCGLKNSVGYQQIVSETVYAPVIQLHDDSFAGLLRMRWLLNKGIA